MNELHSFWRHLGSTGILVSPIGLGTVKLGRDQGVKYPDNFVIPDDALAASLLCEAHDMGVNLLDTAPAYGVSEQRLGFLLRGQRHKWVLSSKVGEEFEQGRSYFDFSATHARFSVERSLRRLGTDYLDIVLVHSDGHDMAVLQQTPIYETLERLKREGWIRAFGFSGKTVEGGIAALQCGDCAMVTYNLNEQSERPVLDKAAQLNRGVLIKKGFASGHACLRGVDTVRDSFELIFAHQAVSSVVIGTINSKHLKQNVETLASILAEKTYI